MCKSSVKKLPLIIRYVTDQYMALEMYDKFTIENGRTLNFFPDC